MKKNAGAGKAEDRADPPRLTRPKSGFKARFKEHRPASAAVPEHLRQIQELALAVWENRENAQEFLSTPHALLDGIPPAVVARTPEGAERVRRILLALEYGLPV